MSKDIPSYEAPADKLFQETGTDWSVQASLVLTEPVCCIITLVSDDPSLPKLEGFIGNYNINESVARACKVILEKL